MEVGGAKDASTASYTSMIVLWVWLMSSTCMQGVATYMYMYMYIYKLYTVFGCS